MALGKCSEARSQPVQHKYPGVLAVVQSPGGYLSALALAEDLLIRVNQATGVSYLELIHLVL